MANRHTPLFTYTAHALRMHRISGSRCKLLDNEPDNLLIYCYQLRSPSWQIAVCKQTVSLSKKG